MDLVLLKLSFDWIDRIYIDFFGRNWYSSLDLDFPLYDVHKKLRGPAMIFEKLFQRSYDPRIPSLPAISDSRNGRQWVSEFS